MRRLSPGVAQAIRNGLNDMVYSQEAVFQAVVRFRNIKGGILSQLAPGLFDLNSAFAYAVVQLLQALGTAETTSFEDRQEIMQLLAAAIEDPSSKREVYVLERDIKVMPLDYGDSIIEDKGISIRYMGLLNSAMYQALLQISGIGRAKWAN